MAFPEEAIRNPPLLSEVRQDDGDDDLHWDPHDYAILDEEEEVAVEEDELEEDEDEDEEEEEEEEGEGEDDEEEEDNNDDGGMTYRSRGGLNGRGAIIRPRSKVAEACVSTELETTSHGVQNQNRQQQQQQQHVLATVTEQPIEGSEDNQNHQSETHIANDDTLGHEDVNVDQGITVSDDTGGLYRLGGRAVVGGWAGWQGLGMVAGWDGARGAVQGGFRG
ncbi:FACT complex subunit SPT16 [Bienertia sinuspersici]